MISSRSFLSGRSLATLMAATSLLLGGCASLEQKLQDAKPTARVAGVSISDMSLDDVTLKVKLAINNPNAIAIPMSGLAMKLLVSGNQLAAVEQPDSSLTLKANGETLTELPVTFRFADLYQVYQASKGQNEVAYAIDADVFTDLPVAGRVSLPANYQGSLPIPQMPKLSLQTVNLEDIGWSGATLRLKLNIDNPNSFGIKVNGLDYNVGAGSNQLASGALGAVDLQANKTALLDLPLKLSFSELGKSVMSLLTSSTATEISFSGALDYQPDLSIWNPQPLKFNVSQTLNR
ncbi:LEA type 2 family protein [Oceanobacter mangrovi]|uniref:NDR1/HIN1-like protein n=1 Tax=Oceanobacter mangrovi TaxID=2862510 RepID=UPI001C8EC6A4|nr:LEA type 2 family protein [Oceanobacter mangrovi]